MLFMQIARPALTVHVYRSYTYAPRRSGRRAAPSSSLRRSWRRLRTTRPRPHDRGHTRRPAAVESPGALRPPACSRLLILTLSRMSPRLVRSEATSAVRPSSMAARRRSETTSAVRPSDVHVAARPRSSPCQHVSYENVARSDHLASRARALLLCFLVAWYLIACP